MTYEDLDREQAICDAATAGPWEVSPDPEEWAEENSGESLGISMDTALKSPGRYRTHHRIDAYDSIYPEDGEWEEAVANLRFIAKARTGWPERIAECRRLREEIERLTNAGVILAQYLRDIQDAGHPQVPIDRKDVQAAQVFELAAIGQPSTAPMLAGYAICQRCGRNYAAQYGTRYRVAQFLLEEAEQGNLVGVVPTGAVVSCTCWRKADPNLIQQGPSSGVNPVQSGPASAAPENEVTNEQNQ